jgi:ribosomal protein S18 acetylase RimI-like enzyme
MNVIIRSARLGDLDAIMAIERACFDAEDTFSRFLFLSFLQRLKGEIFLVAIVPQEKNSTEKVVGFIVVLRKKSIYHYEIATINVDPKYQKKGIGTKLMIKIEERIREKIKPKERKNNSKILIELMVHTQNTAAIGLYEKLGYNLIQLVPNYYRKNRDGLKMVKKMVF